jgi:hypothetical protein
MDKQRKYAILFPASVLAARKLNDPESKPCGIECAISDAIGKAERILAKIEDVACLTQIGHRFLISSGSLRIPENLSSSMAFRTATLSVVSIDSYSFRSMSESCPSF